MEEWKEIPGCGGFYEVSNLGRLRRLSRVTTDGRRWRKRLLKPNAPKTHYLGSKISLNGVHKKIQCHIAVLEAFVGPRPFGHEACHNNGNKHDNRLENLRWDTRSGNFADKKKHGTDTAGEKHYRAKFTNKQAAEIRNSLIGKSDAEVARDFGVSTTCIRHLRIGKTYAQSWALDNDIRLSHTPPLVEA